MRVNFSKDKIGTDIYTLLMLYIKQITNKDLLSSKGNSAQYSVITLWSPGERMGKGIVRLFGMDMDTRPYLTRRASKSLLDSTGKSAQQSVMTYLAKESEKE